MRCIFCHSSDIKVEENGNRYIQKPIAYCNSCGAEWLLNSKELLEHSSKNTATWASTFSKYTSEFNDPVKKVKLPPITEDDVLDFSKKLESSKDEKGNYRISYGR